MPGISSTSMPAARTSSTLRSAIVGLPGTAYDDLAVLARGLDDAVGDRRVHGVEIVGLVVEQIERLEIDAVAGEIVDRRMARGAHEADRDPLERGAGRGKQQVGAGRTEPDDDDARLRPACLRRSGRAPGAPAGAVVVVVVVPSRAVLGVGAFGGRHFVDLLALAVRREAPRAEARIEVHLERLQQRVDRGLRRGLPLLGERAAAPGCARPRSSESRGSRG